MVRRSLGRRRKDDQLPSRPGLTPGIPEFPRGILAPLPRGFKSCETPEGPSPWPPWCRVVSKGAGKVKPKPACRPALPPAPRYIPAPLTAECASPLRHGKLLLLRILQGRVVSVPSLHGAWWGRARVPRGTGSLVGAGEGAGALEGESRLRA